MFERQKQAIKTINFDNAMMMAMSEHTSEIADMNRAQLWTGKDSGAAKMSPSYAISTKKAKAKKEKAGEWGGKREGSGRKVEVKRKVLDRL